jgi:hypothetical protein
MLQQGGAGIASLVVVVRKRRIGEYNFEAKDPPLIGWKIIQLELVGKLIVFFF